MADIRTSNVPAGTTVSDLFGHESVAGVLSTRRFARSVVLGPLETRLDAAEDSIDALELGQGAGTIALETKAALLLLTSGYAEHTKAEVYADGTEAFNGVYENQGTVVTSNWVKISDLAVTTLDARVDALEDDADLSGLTAFIAKSPALAGISLADRLIEGKVFARSAQFATEFRVRALPPGFPALPFMPALVRAPGDVTMNVGLLGAFFQKYPTVAIGIVAYVEATGNDGTADTNDPTKPYLTIDAAFAVANIAVVGDGVFTPPDYRYTDPGAGIARLAIARNPGRTKLRRPGDDISGGTWTATPAQAGVYQRTIAAHPATASGIHRVLLTDTPDARKHPSRLLYFPPPTADAPGYATALATLQAAGTGWTFNPLTHVLHVARGGLDLTISGNRANLRALYLDQNGNGRVFAFGAVLMMEGFILEGLTGDALESPTNIAAELWLSNGWQLFSPIYANLTNGASVLVDNMHIHASQYDGFNGNWGASSNMSLGVFANSAITDCGDTMGFGVSIEQNRQAISAHSGYVAAFGCLLESNDGQEVADVSLGSNPNLSWYVGVEARHGVLGASSTGFGFYGTGSAIATNNRTAWLDTCKAFDEATRSVEITEYASVKLFNNDLDPATPVTFNGGSYTTYTPEAP